MEFRFSSELQWPKATANDHHITLDLDLGLQNILGFENLPMHLKMQEQEIRREIFELVVQQILPKIMEDTDTPTVLPDGHTTSRSSSRIKSNAVVALPKLPGRTLSVENQMQIVMDITTSQRMNAMQALYADRASIATSIANEMVKLLKRAVLKTRDLHVDTSSSLKGNQVESFESRVKKSSSDGN